MSVFRRTTIAVASALVAATMTAGAAGADPEPTTLAVDGTVRVSVVDHFGEHAHAERLHTIRTDDGATIPVDLPDSTPADARFDGELIVRGDVAAELENQDLLPRAGSTIDEDSRAGRAAIAAAEDTEVPLRVGESTVIAAAAGAPAPSAHRAYVARMVDQGSVDGTDTSIGTAVDSMLGYWTAESGGAITSFNRVGPIIAFDSTANIPPSQSCGIQTPNAIWNQAATLWPLVDFTKPGNHLVVLVGDECGVQGPVGVAALGTSIASGGPSILTYDSSTFASTGAHELGHNFGLQHANLTGRDDYRDLYSPMGFAVSGGTAFKPPALGTLHRRQLGLTAAGEVATVAGGSAPQSFSIVPRSATTGSRGVLVTDPVSGTTYSIDLRMRTGRDASAFYGPGRELVGSALRYETGVVLERQDTARQTFLMANTATDPDRGSYGAGQVFAPSAGLRVTVGSVSSTAATVTVELDPVPTTTPAAVPAPALQTLGARTPRVVGTARVGRTLKVKVGSWSPQPWFTYRWYANGRKITSKGTRSSFKLTSRQKGKRITVRVTGRKTGYVTAAKTSSRTRKVARR